LHLLQKTKAKCKPPRQKAEAEKQSYKLTGLTYFLAVLTITADAPAIATKAKLISQAVVLSPVWGEFGSSLGPSGSTDMFGPGAGPVSVISAGVGLGAALAETANVQAITATTTKIRRAFFIIIPPENTLKHKIIAVFIYRIILAHLITFVKRKNYFSATFI
jgi:hypothetical protein